MQVRERYVGARWHCPSRIMDSDERGCLSMNTMLAGKTESLRQDNWYDHDRAAHHFQHLHDLRLVRPFEIPAGAAVQSHSHQLGHRLFRILLPGARQPHRLLRIHRGATEDHPGSDHADRVFGVLGPVPGGAIKWNYIVASRSSWPRSFSFSRSGKRISPLSNTYR